jgi:uncharacterized protein
MTVYVVDSSALVKRCVQEIGSTWVLGLFDSELSEVFVSAITSVEIIAAIARRSRSGSINVDDAAAACTQVRRDLQIDYQVVEITEEIIKTAMTLAETQGLRGYDAVQLATGCAVNGRCITSGLSPAIFVSADNELNVAATREGLSIENPNSYL